MEDNGGGHEGEGKEVHELEIFGHCALPFQLGQ